MLEQFVMYLWTDMPTTALSALFAGLAAIAGASAYLGGRRVMRANNCFPRTRWLTPDGNVIQSDGYGIDRAFGWGRRIARLGIAMTFIALVTYACFMGVC
jgi:hypothetical protein